MPEFFVEFVVTEFRFVRVDAVDRQAAIDLVLHRDEDSDRGATTDQHRIITSVTEE